MGIVDEPFEQRDVKGSWIPMVPNGQTSNPSQTQKGLAYENTVCREMVVLGYP
uniref:Uncharacterized protein n=1 Tax=Rhizophora mucronata TaxID=61149 RepID=A0A2P2P3I1_RHIMU